MRRPTGILIALLALTGPGGTASAQDLASPPPGPVDADFLATLCAANATSDEELETCLEVVGTILAAPGPPPGVEGPTDDELAGPELLAQLGTIVDDAVSAARDTDVQAAIEEAIASAQGVEVEALIAAAIEQAGAAVEGVDVQAIVDEALAQALAAAGAIDVRGTIEEGIETTRSVVDAAELWVVENAEMVCDGGSVGSGVAAAAVVGYLTGSPGLAVRAFEETEEVARDVCDGMTLAG